jgi:uncharacterized membrane protein YbhN (UPF0104 family)
MVDIVVAGTPGATRAPLWRTVAGPLLVGLVAGLVWLNRTSLLEAWLLVRGVDLRWAGGALALVLLSYFISAHVFWIVLRSIGLRVGRLRLWATTITAIVISQSVPAGGVGSYAFLLHAFRRRGIPTGPAALLAALEALSYAVAMTIVGLWSVAYLAAHTLAPGDTLAAPAVAALVAVGLLLLVAFVVTRPADTLLGWLQPVVRPWQRLRRRPTSATPGRSVVDEIVRARRLVATQPAMIALLIGLQLLALAGHSCALLLILWSLGVETSFGVVLATFGMALITSTFNLLPGGGGTVEAVIVAVLMQLGIGLAAAPAAIIFRLLNFWTLLPLATGGYLWQMRGARQPTGPDRQAPDRRDPLIG